ncbi:MAG: hypothetical protein Q8Q00_05530 [Dehalococcoidia bacterium]|nr:hypothetical protein [Dehalococcoidia bacterium]
MYQSLLTELSRYAAGLSTARDLEAWLISELQTILDSNDQEAIDLANQVEGMLVEFSAGLMPEPELRGNIEALARRGETLRLEIVEVPHGVEDSTGSSAVPTITRDFLDRPVVDVRLRRELVA